MIEEEKKSSSAKATEDKETNKEEKTSKTVEKIVSEIEKLKLMEVAELVTALEEKFGVSATMPMAVAATPTAGAGEGAEAAEEKTIFNVELTASGENKINVIKAIREVITTIGLKEAKDLVDGAPKMLKENVKKEEAETMKKKIEAAGGKVTLK